MLNVTITTIGLLAMLSPSDPADRDTDRALPVTAVIPEHLAPSLVTPGAAALLATLGTWTDPTAPAFHALGADAMLSAMSPLPRRHGCNRVAYTAHVGSQIRAKADFLQGIASCINLGGSFGSCSRELWRDHRDALSLARAQLRARLDLCALLGGALYNPDIDPDDFTTEISNRYLPLTPGRTLVYEKTTDEVPRPFA